MESHTIFETVILTTQCVCDNDKLFNEVKNHQKFTKSTSLSNNGGYQGHGFESFTLSEVIKNLIPQRSDQKLKSFFIQAWVNVNYQFSWNDIHTHSDDGVLLSGIYYVSTPKNCGNIRFYDPRFLKGRNLYDKYYFKDRGDHISVQPQEKMLIWFPPWLPHSVEPNLSEQERISIAFNIVNPIYQEG